MDRKDIETYVHLRIKMAEMQTQIDAMKPALIAYVKRLGGKTRYANLTIKVMPRRNYAFSEEVMALLRRLKEKRKEELENGTARVVAETHHLYLSPLKLLSKKVVTLKRVAM